MNSVNKMLLKISTITRTISRNKSSSVTLFDTKINDKSGVATVIMKNAPVNVMSSQFLDSFIDILNDLKKENINGMILTSHFNGVFSAGLDINNFCNPDKSDLSHYCFKFEECWSKLYSCPFTTVAAVNGHAAAGGCLLSLTTEYRIMKNHYKIGLNEVHLGLVAPPWLMENMASIMSRRNTEIALTLGTLFTTQEAYEIGLVDEIVADDIELMTRAEIIMNNFIKVNRQAKNQTKSIFRQKMIKEFNEKREYNREIFISNIMTQDTQERIQTFLQNLKNKNTKQ